MNEHSAGRPERQPPPPASDRIRAHRDQIIQLWHERVLLAIPAAKEHNYAQLRNSLPEFLDRLADSLSPDRLQPTSAPTAHVSRKHAGQRASLKDYTLDQVLREYRILRETVLSVVEREGPISTLERDIILSMIEQSMTESAVRFITLVRARESALGERYRLVVEGVRDHAIMLMDPDGNILDWNTGAMNLFRYTKEDVIGQNSRILFVPEDRAQDASRREIETAIRDGRAEDTRWHLRKDGSRFFSYGVTNPLRDEAGDLQGFVKVLRDETERMKTNEALRASEEGFRRLFENAPVGMAEVDSNTRRFLRANPAYCAMLGYTEDELKSLTVEQITHPDDHAFDTSGVAEATRGSATPYRTEKRYVRKDGSVVWAEVSVTAFKDLEGSPTTNLAVAQDITDRKKAHETLRAAHEQANLHLRKLVEERELRERFVETLTHDLRTPLTAAKVNAQILMRRGNQPDIPLKAASRIADSVDRADQMIRDLLDANRIKAGEKLPVEISRCDLSLIAEETLEELASVHGNRFVLKSPGPVDGHWSCEGLRRILENLCTNALKYGARNRPVTVTLERTPTQIEICVHNEGNPIPPEDQKTLFQPFRRTATAERGGQAGWGLGLTLVRGLAEAHDGSVSVESSEEHGTTFRVRLPLDARSDA